MACFIDVIHRKPEWRGYPGLWDPYRVIEVCLQELNNDIFANMKWKKIDRSNSDKSILQGMCPGVQRYLDKWPIADPQIKEKVLDYLKNPCSEKLKGYVKKDKMTCLFFMLEYFRVRGPFVTIPVDENGIKRNHLSGRFLASMMMGYLKQLPTLDFCAATALGRYLNYMVTIAYLHKHYYFKEVISNIYGPLFLGLDLADDVKYRFKDKKIYDSFIRATFASLVESIPWSQLDPLKDVPRCVFPTGERDLYRRVVYESQLVLDSYVLPSSVRSAVESRSEAVMETPSDPLDPERETHGTDKKFPPDKCNLLFQRKEPVSLI